LVVSTLITLFVEPLKVSILFLFSKEQSSMDGNKKYFNIPFV
jgi:hypothetical protein